MGCVSPPLPRRRPPPVPLPGVEGGAFRSPGEDGGDNAFTYDEVAVPVGSSANIESEEENGRTTVTFSATGLARDRDFGVHVHTQPCGPQPADPGPHYQNDVDPTAGGKAVGCVRSRLDSWGDVAQHAHPTTISFHEHVRCPFVGVELPSRVVRGIRHPSSEDRSIAVDPDSGLPGAVHGRMGQLAGHSIAHVKGGAKAIFQYGEDIFTIDVDAALDLLQKTRAICGRRRNRMA